MQKIERENLLTEACVLLTEEAHRAGFSSSQAFEHRVRLVLSDLLPVCDAVTVDLAPPAQAFPDVALGDFGVEVKFTLNDTWRSVGNSVQETQRVDTVNCIYVVFCKQGGIPEVRWRPYEDCVVHVRTSHVPRFELDMEADRSLFDLMGVRYDDFRQLPMHEKMRYVRDYARGRLKKGERLWWLEDVKDEVHTLPIQVRLYTSLSSEEKYRLRAETALLCPVIVKSGRVRNKYDDAVLFLLTYHGVLCHQARDLFSAGSVANPENDDCGGLYIQRALKLLERGMLDAAARMDDALFVEYWGESVLPENRIRRWLEKADELASGWKPSECLFLQRVY